MPAVNRNAWGGNGTWPGAQTQQVLMTVPRSCRLRRLDETSVLTDALRAEGPASYPLLLPDTS